LACTSGPRSHSLRRSPKNLPSNVQKNRGGPKEKDKHYTYNESVEETAKLIDAEPVEVEAEVPAEENEPIESTQEKDNPAPLLFEE
jgi:hypothetical protein